MSDHQDQPSSQGQPSGYKEGRQAGQTSEKGQRDKGGKGRGAETNPPLHVHTPHCRALGHSRAPTGPAMEPYWPARGGVCPRACATARPGKERGPHAGQAGHTHSITRQHAPRHKAQHHHGKHPRPTTNKPPRTSPAVPTAQQLPSRWTCVRPAGYQNLAAYETAAVRRDVCAPGSEPCPCRLRDSRSPDGRV